MSPMDSLMMRMSLQMAQDRRLLMVGSLQRNQSLQ